MHFNMYLDLQAFSICHQFTQAPNAGRQLLPKAGATPERSNCLDCQGLFSLMPR